MNASDPAAAACNQAPGMVAPVVELGRCEGKGDCVRVCPENVFQVRRIDESDYQSLNLLHRFKLRVHGMKVAYMPNVDACRACSLCVSSCPEQAITLRRTSSQARGMS
jgi:ferredoxin